MLEKIVHCPRCASGVELGAHPRCVNPDCPYHRQGFPLAGNQPVLVDFDNSIFRREAYADGQGAVLSRPNRGHGLRARAIEFLVGVNPVAPGHCAALLARLKAATPRPVVLVIGGGSIGSGAEALYADPAVTVIGTDVYASPNTRLIADGHNLPFRDATFDAVWIQAVLEHVLNPTEVVAQIHRVLKPGGLVYAETPFMQQVHEEAYDFTRFTHSGHRWLFRAFEQIDAGTVSGPGFALLWSLRYFLRAFGLPKIATLAATLPFFWLRFLDRFAKPGLSADAASGIYFLGRKGEKTLTPKDMIAYYASSRNER